MPLKEAEAQVEAESTSGKTFVQASQAYTNTTNHLCAF